MSSQHPSQTLHAAALAIHRARRVVVVTGAGISVAAGIPDFRSENGLYHLVKQTCPDMVLKGQELFDARLFSNTQTTMVFYSLMASLKTKTDNANVTETHGFIKTLVDRGKLLRCYTQNIDGLEERLGLRIDSSDTLCLDDVSNNNGTVLPNCPITTAAKATTDGVADISTAMGVTKSKCRKNPLHQYHVVQLHGTLSQVNCIMCKAQYRFKEEYIAQFSSGAPPQCPSCTEVDAIRTALNKRSLAIGTLRPSIILYNEVHPRGDLIGECAAADIARRPDMLIVMGTSLKVHGIKQLVKTLAKTVKQHAKGQCILVNKTKLSKEWDETFDMVFTDECDKVVHKWEKDLLAFANETALRKEKRDTAKAVREQRHLKSVKGQTTLPFPIVKSPARYAQRTIIAASKLGKENKPLHLTVDSDSDEPDTFRDQINSTFTMAPQPRNPTLTLIVAPGVRSSKRQVSTINTNEDTDTTLPVMAISSSQTQRRSPQRSPTKQITFQRRPYPAAAANTTKRLLALKSNTIVTRSRLRADLYARESLFSDASDGFTSALQGVTLSSELSTLSSLDNMSDFESSDILR